VPVFNELISLKNNAFLERDFLPLVVDNQQQGFTNMLLNMSAPNKA